MYASSQSVVSCSVGKHSEREIVIFRIICWTRSSAGGGPRLDRRVRIQLGRVHFGVFSTSRFVPPALSSDWHTFSYFLCTSSWRHCTFSWLPCTFSLLWCTFHLLFVYFFVLFQYFSRTLLYFFITFPYFFPFFPVFFAKSKIYFKKIKNSKQKFTGTCNS